MQISQNVVLLTPSFQSCSGGYILPKPKYKIKIVFSLWLEFC